MKKVYIIICIAFAWLCSSCGNFLTEYSQDQAYVRTYTDLDELLAGSVYMKCYPLSYTYGYSIEQTFYPYVHFMADETQVCLTGSSGVGTGSEYLFGYYTWQQDVEKDHEGTDVWPEDQDWRNLYNYINVANLILSLIDEQEAITEADVQNVQRIKGEAHFLRGAYYFILANLYGEPYSPVTASTDLAVPLKLSEFIEDRIYKRATVAEVYRQVLADLQAAEGYLKGIPRKSVFRADHAAVCLLLSRVYLYMQDYEECVKWAKACLEEQSTLVNLNTFAGTDFLTKDSPELIFSMGSNHLPLNLVSSSSYSPAGEFMISKDLYSCYRKEDLRTQFFIKSDGGFVTYEKIHYAYGTTLEVSDNFAFRTAEAYLNLAEAAACLGGSYTTDALEAYNTLRKNRIAGYQEESGLSGKALVDSVRMERRRELCLEGHRWFDLRRYMVNEAYPEEITLTNEYAVWEYNYTSYEYVMTLHRRYTLPPHDEAWTLPIPAEELNANYGMPDNPRYPREYVSL